MISEGLCDTEDWNSGCWEYSFAITEINCFLKYIKLQNILNCDVSQYYYIFNK